MSNQIELRHIRYFLALAEELHFRKASERLYISQPGLSRQIKQMEEQLDVSLFKRHNRKVELTIPGAYLKKELGGYISELDTILKHAKLLDQGIEGNLKLGYVGSAMLNLIPTLLLQFKKEYPKIIFDLKEMDNQRQVQNLLSKEIDIAFLRLENLPADIKSFPIIKECFCLVLPKKHKINASNFKSLKQLKDESFILFDPSYSPSYYEKVMQIFIDHGFTPKISHNTINAISIYRLVENNLGFSIVPKSLQIHKAMGVKYIELDKIKQRTVLSVAWNKENRNPILSSMLSLIKAQR